MVQNDSCLIAFFFSPKKYILQSKQFYDKTLGLQISFNFKCS